VAPAVVPPVPQPDPQPGPENDADVPKLDITNPGTATPPNLPFGEPDASGNATGEGAAETPAQQP
jgi:hypothetical protein